MIKALPKNKFLILTLAVSAVGLGSLVPFSSILEKTSSITGSKSELTKNDLSEALQNAGVFQEYPAEITLPVKGKNEKAIVQYAFDAKLQAAMEDLFRNYRPDYGAFVAMDANTGRILSMISYNHDDGQIQDNLALRATFPSASVFKVVTAAAAISEKNFSANTMISFNGRNHTLYKSNILKLTNNRWTRHMTLKEAFAHSVNTVFGRLGAFTIGAETLRAYAARFGFNRKIAGDLPIQEGRAEITDDAWSLAETASGYTRDNTMSPLQGALIAASVANDGVMMEPYVVETVHGQDGSVIYQAEPKIGSQTVSSEAAAEIRALMRETIVRGTSRKSFRGFARGDLAYVDVGGKTGSLTGMDPRGKYDWFVGFAGRGDQKIAIAALTVHEKLWRVKSSYLARKAIETYFKRTQSERNVAQVRSRSNRG